MREVCFYDYGGVSYLYLSKEHRLFFLYSLFWWGGRAGLMRQIANLLTVVRRSGGSNPLPIAFIPV